MSRLDGNKEEYEKNRLLPAREMHYRGTPLISKSLPVGHYSRTMPRALWWPWGGGAVSYERGTPVPAKVAMHSDFRGNSRQVTMPTIPFRT